MIAPYNPPFWFLNGELTAEELRRQLADFAPHGIYGVVPHPRMGLSPDITYLGERYFALIRTADVYKRQQWCRGWRAA